MKYMFYIYKVSIGIYIVIMFMIIIIIMVIYLIYRFFDWVEGFCNGRCGMFIVYKFGCIEMEKKYVLNMSDFRFFVKFFY